MRARTLVALPILALLLTLVVVTNPRSSEDSPGILVGAVEMAATMETTTTLEPIETAEVVAPAPAPVEPEPLPLAPPCDTWASQGEANAWMDEHGSAHDTSLIDTDGDGIPCTLHFAPTTTVPAPPEPPPAPEPPTPAPEPTPAPAPAPAPASGIEGIIHAAAAEFGVDGALMVRIARCESNLNPSVVNSSSGALGLFQHMPQYWGGRAANLGYGYDAWSDPVANARVSAVLMRDGGPSHWVACL